MIQLLAGGDKEMPVRCGAAAFDVRKGQGHSTLLVVDTEQTPIEGDARFDLDHEWFDATMGRKPKRLVIVISVAG